MSTDPVMERLRTVERDWRELHDQNNLLVELNTNFEKRAKEAEAALAELVEASGRAADRIDNLLAALTLPVRDAIHLQGVRGTLPEIGEELRAALAKAEDPTP